MKKKGAVIVSIMIGGNEEEECPMCGMPEDECKCDSCKSCGEKESECECEDYEEED
jgi:hypothetical protein